MLYNRDDIFSTKIMRRELVVDKEQKIEKLKEEFLVMLTHELKTPLTPIILLASALKNENILGKLTANQLEAVNTISDSADELSKLISNIFYSYNLDLKNIEFSSQKIKVDEIMNQVYTINKKIIDQKEISFENITLEIETMYGDSEKILHIMNNLIDNAIDFVEPNNGKIEINAITNNDSIIFYVKDNGIGISKKNQKNLFQKFYQVDTSITRKHSGSGLGLSICHGLVTRMNGKIWVVSKVGKGTIFYFSLPKDQQKICSEESKKSERPTISN